MAFLMITDSTMINTDCIESIEKGSKFSTKIIMASGEKHSADFTFEVMVKRIAKVENDMSSLLKSIDSKTQGIRV